MAKAGEKPTEFSIQLREKKKPEESMVYWKNSSAVTLLKLPAKRNDRGKSPALIGTPLG
jgi:hypothetical protein